MIAVATQLAANGTAREVLRMTPRHALQAAALQFGRDGTNRSLEALVKALQVLPIDQFPAGAVSTASFDARHAMEPLSPPVLDFSTATLEESHAE
jgi:hypothetical protein